VRCADLVRANVPGVGPASQPVPAKMLLGQSDLAVLDTACTSHMRTLDCTVTNCGRYNDQDVETL